MQVELLDHQYDFLHNTSQQCLIAGGIGSAKTTAGTFFTIKMVAEWPEVVGLITANTYTQLQSATLQNLEEWCERLDIPYKTNFNKKMITVNGTSIMVRSADKYDNSRGIEVGWWYGDECCYYSEEAYKVFIGRLRAKNSPLIARFTSTPAGYNWAYHLFHKRGDKYDEKRFSLIEAKTSDNTFLDSDYIEMLKSSYSAAYIRQEVLGEFISLGGMNVYEFDRNIHVKDVHHLFVNAPSQQLYVVVDYNLEPFAGVVGFMEKGIMYIIDEIYLEGGADVRQMAHAIKAKYGTSSPLIMGDSTGNTKRSILNIKLTAYQIFNEVGLTTVQFHNPHVVKRLANINGHLYHNRLFIDPRCKHLIKDMELVQYKKGTNDIDKPPNKDITHISDAAGYFAWKLKPLEPTTRGSKTYHF